MAEAKGHRPRHFRAMTVGLSGQRIFGRAGIRFYASASRGTRPADAAELGAAAHFIDVGVAGEAAPGSLAAAQLERLLRKTPLRRMVKS